MAGLHGPRTARVHTANQRGWRGQENRQKVSLHTFIENYPELLRKINGIPISLRAPYLRCYYTPQPTTSLTQTFVRKPLSLQTLGTVTQDSRALPLPMPRVCLQHALIFVFMLLITMVISS